MWIFPESRNADFKLYGRKLFLPLTMLIENTIPSADKHADDKLDDVSDDVEFGGESTLPPAPTLTPEAERKLWLKVDLRLIPILAVMYLLSFMDRGEPYEYHKALTIWWLLGNIGRDFIYIYGGNISLIWWIQETRDYRALRASSILSEINIT